MSAIETLQTGIDEANKRIAETHDLMIGATTDQLLELAVVLVKQLIIMETFTISLEAVKEYDKGTTSTEA